MCTVIAPVMDVGDQALVVAHVTGPGTISPPMIWSLEDARRGYHQEPKESRFMVCFSTTSRQEKHSISKWYCLQSLYAIAAQTGL